MDGCHRPRKRLRTRPARLENATSKKSLTYYVATIPYGEEDKAFLQGISMEDCVSLPWYVQLRIIMYNSQRRSGLLKLIHHKVKSQSKTPEEEGSLMEDLSWKNDWLVRNWEISSHQLRLDARNWSETERQDLNDIMERVDSILGVSCRNMITTTVGCAGTRLCERVRARMNVSKEATQQVNDKGRRRPTQKNLSPHFLEWITKKTSSRLAADVEQLCRAVASRKHSPKIIQNIQEAGDTDEGRTELAELADQLAKCTNERMGVARILYYMERMGVPVQHHLTLLPNSVSKKVFHRATLESAVDHYLSTGIPCVRSLVLCLWNQIVKSDSEAKDIVLDIVKQYNPWLPLDPLKEPFQLLLEQFMTQKQLSTRDSWLVLQKATDMIMVLWESDCLEVLDTEFCWRAILPSVLASSLVSVSCQSHPYDFLSSCYLFLSIVERMTGGQTEALKGHPHICWLLKEVAMTSPGPGVDEGVRRAATRLSMLAMRIRGGQKNGSGHLPPIQVLLRHAVSLSRRFSSLGQGVSIWCRRFLATTLSSYDLQEASREWISVLMSSLSEIPTTSTKPSHEAIVFSLHQHISEQIIVPAGLAVSQLVLRSDVNSSEKTNLQILIHTPPEALFNTEPAEMVYNCIQVIARRFKLSLPLMVVTLRGLSLWQSKTDTVEKDVCNHLAECIAQVSPSPHDVLNLVDVVCFEFGTVVGLAMKERLKPLLTGHDDSLRDDVPGIFDTLITLDSSTVSDSPGLDHTVDESTRKPSQHELNDNDRDKTVANNEESVVAVVPVQTTSCLSKATSDSDEDFDENDDRVLLLEL